MCFFVLKVELARSVHASLIYLLFLWDLCVDKLKSVSFLLLVCCGHFVSGPGHKNLREVWVYVCVEGVSAIVWFWGNFY